MERKLSWDGEKILEEVKAEEKKFTPKDVINSIDQIQGQIAQMVGSIDQAREKLVASETQLKSMKSFEAELKPFEEKCLELQKDHMLKVIAQIHDDIYKAAVESSKATIAKDPEAYNDAQKNNLPYLDYQKGLAVNKKMNDKVATRMIRQFLFEEPVFDNPFKE